MRRTNGRDSRWDMGWVGGWVGESRVSGENPQHKEQTMEVENFNNHHKLFELCCYLYLSGICMYSSSSSILYTLEASAPLRYA